MTRFFTAASLWDTSALVLKILLLLWFCQPLKARTECRWRPMGFVSLALLSFLYISPASALLNLYSLENLAIQFGRMLLHWGPIFGYLALTKEIKWPVAAYLSGFVTVVFLAAQNCRAAAIVFTQSAADENFRRFTLFLAVFAEWGLAALLRAALDLNRIRQVSRSCWSVLILALLLEVYFKWWLVAMQFTQLPYYGRDFALFAVCAALGVLLVLVLVERNQRTLEDKNRIETDRLSLNYEMQNAKRALQTNNDIRRLYHDLKNHLLAIQSMAGDKQELQDYLEELLPQFEGYETRVSTGSGIIDALLSEKIQRAGLDSIQFNVCLDLHDLEFMKSVDLITLFGNATDNAIEAVQMLPEVHDRLIYIKSSRFANMLVLRFSNQFAGTIAPKNGLLPTSKRDATAHGIGLDSIRRAVHRYHGTVSAEPDNDKKWFHLIVMIPVEEK